MPSSRLLYKELIKESEEELLQLEKSKQLSYVKDRVRFIGYLKEGTAKSQARAGSLIGLHSRQSQQSILALIYGRSINRRAWRGCCRPGKLLI